MSAPPADDLRYPYELTSHWLVPGKIADVYAILTDGDSLPRWWPQAYRRVREVRKGDARGVGRMSEIVTRGALPYEVHWRLEIIDAAPPTMVKVRASGELTGLGEWRLVEKGENVSLVYVWRVAVEKEWLRRLQFILKPLFALNHEWVMRKGEAGMKAELARRARG